MAVLVVANMAIAARRGRQSSLELLVGRIVGPPDRQTARQPDSQTDRPTDRQTAKLFGCRTVALGWKPQVASCWLESVGKTRESAR